MLTLNSVDTEKRVLVIDDEQGILTFTRIRLNLAGYEVITTTSGEDGLRLAQSEKPDIVLLDILMVPTSGLEVLDKLRTFSQVPVIVFTGQRFIADQAIKMGATDYIAKPFDPDELVRKIKGIWDHRKASHATSGL